MIRPDGAPSPRPLASTVGAATAATLINHGGAGSPSIPGSIPGRADATLHDSPVAAYYSKLFPDFEVAIANFDSAPEGIAVAKNNADMLNAVKQAMDAMTKDGTLDKIKAKWGVK